MKNAIAARKQTPANSINMPVNRLGRSYIYDPTASRMISLPTDWRIYHFTDRAWIGGSIDGQAYLHVEKMPSGKNTLPTIWAEEDLDLYICTTSQEKISNNNTTSADVAGSFADQAVEGIISKIEINAKEAYLVLMIGGENAINLDLESAARAIAKSMVGI